MTDTPERAREWQPFDTAPKQIVSTRDHNQYGPWFLAFVWGEVTMMRWWQRDDEPDARNFLSMYGRAEHFTHWMPLPDPPVALGAAVAPVEGPS